MPKSQSEDDSIQETAFTAEEQQLLARYREPAKDMARSQRLSIQYLVGAGIFALLAVTEGQPLFGLVSYAVFVLYVVLRLRGGRHLSHALPRLLEKYDQRLAQLEAQAGVERP